MSDKVGIKYDGEKLRYDLLHMEAIDQLVRVLTIGAKKYDDNNWMYVEPYRYKGAVMRHLSSYLQGEILDSETGVEHLAHAMANCMFLMWHDKNGNSGDKNERSQ